MLGQISYEQCPAVPPELLMLPTWFPVSLYAMSSWSRTIVVPLPIMSAHRPVVELDPRFGIRELFLQSPEHWPPLCCPGVKASRGLLSWDRFFRTIDVGLRFLQRNNLLPFRKRALAMAERWIVERFEGSDGLGAIFPPMVWSVIALRCLGYADDSPQLKYCYERLEGLYIEDEDTLRLEPCKSPVWDTGITLRALADSGLQPDHPAVERAVEWLLNMQITKPGDWSKTVQAEPAAWCFEFANDFYPDSDDTSMVVMALANQFAPAAADALVPDLQLIAEKPECIGQRTERSDRVVATHDPSHRRRRALAAGHAEPRRRLGRVRSRQRSRVPVLHSVRRP